MPQHIIQAPDKVCEACGATFNRKRYNGTLEDMGRYKRRRFCSQSCGNTRLTSLKKDTLHWRARKYRAETCAECGTTERLHVHHIDRNPSNNDPANLTTLCASHHLKLHWREDREQRMAAVRAAASRGANTRPRSTDGRFCSVA